MMWGVYTGSTVGDVYMGFEAQASEKPEEALITDSRSKTDAIYFRRFRV